MTFLICFVAEPQLRLAALPESRAVSDIHADWSLVTKGGFMPRRHDLTFYWRCVERFAAVIVPQQGHGCGGMPQPGLVVVNV